MEKRTQRKYFNSIYSSYCFGEFGIVKNKRATFLNTKFNPYKVHFKSTFYSNLNSALLYLAPDFLFRASTCLCCYPFFIALQTSKL